MPVKAPGPVTLQDRQGVFVHSVKCSICDLEFMVFSWRANRHRVGSTFCPECGKPTPMIHWRTQTSQSLDFCCGGPGREIYQMFSQADAPVMNDSRRPGRRQVHLPPQPHGVYGPRYRRRRREWRRAQMTWENYMAAHVRVESPTGLIEVRPAPSGGVSEPFPDPTGRTIHIITAYNPNGRDRSHAVNVKAHGRLLATLREQGLEHWDASGGDATWTHVEQGVAIIGISEAEALALGRKFDQEAVYAWAPQTWGVIGCDENRRYTSGWNSSRDQASQELQDAIELLGLPGPGYSAAKVREAMQLALARTEPGSTDMLRGPLNLVKRHIAGQDEVAKANDAAASAFGVAAVAARKQAQKEQKAFASKATAAEHAANVSAGWPATWNPAHVHRWAAAGGDLEATRRFAESGWDPTEILELLDYHEVTVGQGPPAGAAADHRMHGDTLVSLLSQEWLPTPNNTILSLKRTLRSGRRDRWTISESDGRLRLRQQSASPTGTWRTVRDEDAGTDVAAAIAASGAFRTVRRGAINEYTLRKAPPDWWGLLSLLRVSAAGGDEDSEGWPEGVPDDWSDKDDYVLEIMGPAPLVNRWCTIQGVRLFALQVGRKTVPMLVDLDADELEGAREVARYTWFSESGGAPISWDGGNSLSVVDESLLWARQWGDEGEESEFSNLPRTPLSLAGLIADWVGSIGAEVPAAFSLEPFDPSGTLSAANAELWGERFQGVDASLSFDLNTDVLAYLRRRLTRRNALYRRTRNAFFRPQGKDGQALATALDAVLREGVLGQLLYGRWEG